MFCKKFRELYLSLNDQNNFVKNKKIIGERKERELKWGGIRNEGRESET